MVNAYRPVGGASMVVKGFGESNPSLGRGVYVAEEALVVGRVRLGDKVSVWPGAVVRGDEDLIEVGEESNVQDNCVLHADKGYPALVGKRVTVGHSAIVHGARVGDMVLIGMGAILLSGVIVGEESIVAAGSLLPEGKNYPSRSVIMGMPGRVVRRVGDRDLARIKESYEAYLQLSQSHL